MCLLVFWRSFGAVETTENLFSRTSLMSVRKSDGAKIAFFCVSKKIVTLHPQSIGYESELYIYHFVPVLFFGGQLHLLRQRKRPRNRPKLFWLTVLQLGFECVVERGPDGGEISGAVALYVLCG